MKQINLVIVGVLRRRFFEYVRVVELLSPDVRLVYGGHIGDGSNSQQRAERLLRTADGAIWNERQSRHLKNGLSGLPFERFSGRGSFERALRRVLSKLTDAA